MYRTKVKDTLAVGLVGCRGLKNHHAVKGTGKLRSSNRCYVPQALWKHSLQEPTPAVVEKTTKRKLPSYLSTIWGGEGETKQNKLGMTTRQMSTKGGNSTSLAAGELVKKFLETNGQLIRRKDLVVK